MSTSIRLICSSYKRMGCRKNLQYYVKMQETKEAIIVQKQDCPHHTTHRCQVDGDISRFIRGDFGGKKVYEERDGKLAEITNDILPEEVLHFN